MASIYISSTGSRKDSRLVQDLVAAVRAAGHTLLNDRSAGAGQTIGDVRRSIFQDFECAVVVYTEAYAQECEDELRELLAACPPRSVLLVSFLPVPDEFADHVIPVQGNQPDFVDQALKLLPQSDRPESPGNGGAASCDIGVFVASSSEMAEERKTAELVILKVGFELKCRLKPVFWEDLRQDFHGDDVQDRFDDELRKCDIVIAMFYKKVGEFTRRELALADELRRERGRPRLLVFFKKGSVDLDEVDPDLLKRGELRQYIRESKQMSINFDDADDLKRRLQEQLQMIVEAIQGC